MRSVRAIYDSATAFGAMGVAYAVDIIRSEHDKEYS
jgi:hypothetical protein